MQYVSSWGLWIELLLLWIEGSKSWRFCPKGNPNMFSEAPLTESGSKTTWAVCGRSDIKEGSQSSCRNKRFQLLVYASKDGGSHMNIRISFAVLSSTLNFEF